MKNDPLIYSAAAFVAAVAAISVESYPPLLVLAGLETMSIQVKAYRKDHGVNTAHLTPELTTPVAYSQDMPYDPSSRDPMRAPYGYIATEQDWLLIGRGPDEQLSPVWKEGTILDAMDLILLSYDPTNGIDSTGDLFFSRSDVKGMHE
ncbi:hypothetical protein KQI84_00550 [bacterium]|nr:hypothetical protein [bacterium]